MDEVEPERGWFLMGRIHTRLVPSVKHDFFDDGAGEGGPEFARELRGNDQGFWAYYNYIISFLDTQRTIVVLTNNRGVPDLAAGRIRPRKSSSEGRRSGNFRGRLSIARPVNYP